MPRFRYRMQNILDLKIKTEGQAKMEFGAAMALLREEEQKLEALYARKERYFEEGRQMRNAASLPVREIMQNDTFMERMDELIEEQKLAILRAEEYVEEKRRVLTIEMQERKMHERLRERAFEQYLEEEKRAEAVESDQRSSFVYGQRIQEQV